MTDEKKQEFTRRITQANKSELVVILYDIFFFYIEEAQKMYENADKTAFRQQIGFAQDCLNELIASLHMEQELAKSIFRVYLFVSGCLGQAKGMAKPDALPDAVRLMRKLYETYKEDAKSDTSMPVMENTQTVYAGLTYGKNDLNESCQMQNMNRGYFA